MQEAFTTNNLHSHSRMAKLELRVLNLAIDCFNTPILTISLPQITVITCQTLLIEISNLAVKAGQVLAKEEVMRDNQIKYNNSSSLIRTNKEESVKVNQVSLEKRKITNSLS